MKKAFSVLLALSMLVAVTIVSVADTQTVVSDTSVQVYGPLDSYASVSDIAWGTPSSAVITWHHLSWPDIAGANWISNTYYIEGNIGGNTWRRFSKTVPLCSHAHDISGTIKVNSDNAEETYLNGVLIGTDGEVQGAFVDNHEWNTIISYPFTSVPVDSLVFDFIVRNYQGQSSATGNPTGISFSIDITYDCVVEVEIDVKPGSDPSCFNNDGNGVIPVAILGSETFDVAQIDVETVALEGLAVAAKGKANKLLAAYEDVNGDGITDLVVKIEDVDGTFAQGSGTATLTGQLLDGTPIIGTGDICITQ